MTLWWHVLRVGRTSSKLYQSPGWVTRVGDWMELDLGEDRDLTGVVTQARGNQGAHSVTHFKIQYKLEGADAFVELDSELKGPTVEFLENATLQALDKHRLFNAFFPEVIRARYLRMVVVTCHVACNIRAEVLLNVGNNPFRGKHVFRRCLNTDRYTRVISVGTYTQHMQKQTTSVANVACIIST